MQNVLAFYLKCTCVLVQMYLRFVQNSLAFHLKRKAFQKATPESAKMVDFAHR